MPRTVVTIQKDHFMDLLKLASMPIESGTIRAAMRNTLSRKTTYIDGMSAALRDLRDRIVREDQAEKDAAARVCTPEDLPLVRKLVSAFLHDNAPAWSEEDFERGRKLLAKLPAHPVESPPDPATDQEVFWYAELKLIKELAQFGFDELGRSSEHAPEWDRGRCALIIDKATRLLNSNDEQGRAEPSTGRIFVKHTYEELELIKNLCVEALNINESTEQDWSWLREKPCRSLMNKVKRFMGGHRE